MCVKVENISLSDLKEMMQDIVSSSERVMLVELSNVKNQVDATLEQATKTNGRVDTLEDDLRDLQEEGRTHYTKCPSVDAIRALQDKDLKDSTIKTTLWKVGVMIIGTISLLMSIFAFVAGYI